jgi:kynureninase
MIVHPSDSDPRSTEDDLLRWRNEFPILESTVYMISNSLGAMPRAVYGEMQDFAHTWATRGVRAWEETWWDMAGEVSDLLASILGAEPGSVSMHQNVSIAEAIIASCFDFSGRRNKVVYTDMNFPSVMYVYEAHRARGARVVTVPSPDGIGVPTERLLEAIDEETLLVPISHVLFRSAFIQDAAAIVKRAHEVGARVILDVYQSAGTVPFDLRALGVDFAVGGSVKWLCGGPGAGYLYVRKDLVNDLRPMVTGWMAHKRPFAFETGPIDFTCDAYRFMNGTPHIPALYAARSGYRIIREVGVDRIRRKSMRQTARMIARAERLGFQVTAPRDPDRRGGTVAVDCPHSQAVSKELLRREFIVDWRPKAGIRISPHFYSTDEECDRTLDEIRSILEDGSYRRHE